MRCEYLPFVGPCFARPAPGYTTNIFKGACWSPSIFAPLFPPLPSCPFKMPPRKATTAKKAEPLVLYPSGSFSHAYLYLLRSPDVQPTVIVPVVEPSAQAAPEPAAKPAPKAKPAAKPKAKPTAKPKAKPANMSATIAPKPVAAVAAKTAPKPKARAKPKSPEYIESGSDGFVVYLLYCLWSSPDEHPL